MESSLSRAGSWAALTAGAFWITRRLSRVSLENRVVLITGGSRGLGFELAREFRRRGARVAICARNEAELAEAKSRLEREFPPAGSVLAGVCDVTRIEDVRRFIARISETFGRLDAVVNNAGIIQVGPVEEMRIREFADVMRVNYWGTVHSTLAALPLLRRGSRIVNITSIGAIVGVPHLIPYSAAKFAQLGFSLGLAAELRRKGIRVVSVIPGLMRTGSFVHAIFRGQRAKEFLWFSAAAASRLTALRPEHVARRVVDACESGRPVLTLSLHAKAGRLLFAIFPGLGTRVLALGNRLLPRPRKSKQPLAA